MLSLCGTALLRLSYILFLFCFVFAAFAYGLTRDAPLHAFEIAMALTFFLWLLGHIFQRGWPQIHWMAWTIVLFILGFGWFMTVNAWISDAIADDILPSWGDWYPSSLLIYWASRDTQLSVEAMYRTSTLLAGMLVAIEMWSRPRAARALLVTIIVTPLGMTTLFFLQKAVGAPFLLQGVDGKTVLSFATYRYWGNAASFLCLFWPVSVAVALYAAARRTYAWPLWIIPATALYFANFLNRSKAGNVLALIGIVMVGIFILPAALKERRKRKLRMQPRILAAIALPFLIIVVSAFFAIPWGRWDHLQQTTEEGKDGGRSDFYRAFVKMVPDAGWPGFGPGNFQRYYRKYLPNRPEMQNQPYWVAHEDYIQTLVEWGYLGAILWALLLVPATLALARTALGPTSKEKNPSDPYLITASDHIKAVGASLPGSRTPALAGGALVALILTGLHSLVDFPMQIASLQLYFLIYVALGWGLLNAPRDSDKAFTIE